MTQDLLWSRILSGSESLVGQDMQVKRRCAQKGGICFNRGDLQLFMTILEENNLIKAAELLYLSPSTAGARLRAMEDELGFELFERKRGVKTALPTPKVHGTKCL